LVLEEPLRQWKRREKESEVNAFVICQGQVKLSLSNCNFIPFDLAMSVGTFPFQIFLLTVFLSNELPYRLQNKRLFKASLQVNCRQFLSLVEKVVELAANATVSNKLTDYYARVRSY
jgi:hypothetical protein